MDVHYSVSICRHTKTNGHRCKAPALATSAFCRHHQKSRRTRRTTIGTGPALSTHVLHPLHNAQSIQQAIGMVLSALTSGRLHYKAGTKMLYGLQVAVSNLDKPKRNELFSCNSNG